MERVDQMSEIDNLNKEIMTVPIYRRADITPAEVAELRAEVDRLNAYEQDYKNIMAERCGDELHCTCVPGLRAEVEKLRTSNADIKNAIELTMELSYKRYTALHDIYVFASVKSTDWCRRQAAKGLGVGGEE